MTIKRVLEINDKNYNDTFELFSKNGYFHHKSLHIFDTYEVAQICVELTAEYNDEDDICTIDKVELIDTIIDYVQKYIKPIAHEIYTVAIEDINDDEEIEWR